VQPGCQTEMPFEQSTGPPKSIQNHRSVGRHGKSRPENLIA
jgi:hypothetical protein